MGSAIGGVTNGSAWLGRCITVALMGQLSLGKFRCSWTVASVQASVWQASKQVR